MLVVLYEYAHVKLLDSVYLICDMILINYLKNNLRVTDHGFIFI